MNGTHSITRALMNHGASNSMPDFNCITPLMLACANNDVVHCKILCSKIIEIDAQDENGWTALHYCAFANAAKCTTFLINEGANRNIKDGNNRKPLHVARFKQSGDVEALLEDMKSKLADMGEELEQAEQ
jgi:ankyrin repeat protein